MDKLTELAELAHISSSYIDKVGNIHFTDDYVRKYFLKFMGYNVDTLSQIEENIKQLKKDTFLPTVMSFFENEIISFCVKKEGSFNAVLIDENNNIIWSENILGNQDVVIPNLDFGYYDLIVSASNFECKSFVIHAPQKAYLPSFTQNNEHIYGTAVMLYALHSENSMGIGDFSDLKEIVKLTADCGGDVVGVNPLGVMSPYTQNEEKLKRAFKIDTQNIHNAFKQSDVSPYRALSRLFINYAYLDLRKEPDFINSVIVQEFMKLPSTIAEIERLNKVDKVEYANVLKLKLQILELMYKNFQISDENRKKEFEFFCKEKGFELENLATFETLLEENSPEDFWRYWDNNYDKVFSSEVDEFKLKNAERIKFYKYCHWLADKQVKDVQCYATSLGMKIGLYTDMPIGAASNGVEVWENPDAFVLEAGVGAPADPMRPKGQSWGFNPYNPDTLKKQKYAPFIKLVRENLKYSGALRIDHAMGLQRLFWGFYTEDNPVVQGAYVYYEIKDLVAILTLESVRSKCMIICEDLGTVPEGFREYMADHALLSYKVLCRQKEKDGSFRAPNNYIYLSLVQTSTHDQATACGFWNNEDIKVFNDCNLYVNDKQLNDNLTGRAKDRENLIKAFEKECLISSDEAFELKKSADRGDFIPESIHEKMNIYGAKCNSALFLIRINDIYKQIVLDNAPGTVVEYPNWRIKMKPSIEDICNTNDFKNMMYKIKSNRPK